MVDLSRLETFFSFKQVKQASFNLWVDKALSCDGFPIFFFKKFWPTMRNDLKKLCDDSYIAKTNLTRIN